MRIAVVAVVVLVLPLTAAAQPGMTPMTAPPGPEPVVVAPQPKVHFEVGLVAASPKGDWKAAGAETSPGFHVQLGVAVSPNLSLFGALRYVGVQFTPDSGVPADAQISHRELQLGLRFTSPISPGAKLFVEGNLHSATIAADYQGDSQSESGGGLGVRAGVLFMMSRTLALGVGVDYSSSTITADSPDTQMDFKDEWVGANGFVSFLF